jgi:hypothetical protein
MLWSMGVELLKDGSQKREKHRTEIKGENVDKL